MVGHVTRDEDRRWRRPLLGGAASYAARAAACLGYETALVTVAPPDDPLLEPLRRAPRLSLHCLPSDVMTTFALAYAAGQRQLWLRRRARALVLDDIPWQWRRPRVAYVGPVAGECDLAFAHGLGASFLGAGIQGWLRRIGEDGRVEPALLAETPDAETTRLDLAIVSEEDHPGAEGAARRPGPDGGDHPRRSSGRPAGLPETERLEITRQRRRRRGRSRRCRRDVFGEGVEVGASRRSCSPSRAGCAAVAAARVVEGPGLGTLSGSER